MAPELYPFQRDVIAHVADQIARGNRRILLVAPTGAGKTVIGSAIIRESVTRRDRVLFLAHRRELIRQTSEKLFRVGVDHGILQAGFPPRPWEHVQVASVATLHARAVRTKAVEMPPAHLVMVDEAHHVVARTYQRIIESYPGAVLIGLTATPCRADGRGLGNIFDVIVEAPSVAKLIEGGYLVSSRIFAPTRPDLKGVRVEHGDYVESQLAERMDQPKLVGGIVEHWLRLSECRPTVLFATGILHSVHLRDEFRRIGVVAEHVDGQTPVEERDGILKRLAAGEVDLVSNCAVLTEGWDCPSVSCLVLARPTKSLGLYRQMVGRVLRTAPGKSNALILDHSGAVFEHGFPEDNIKWELSEDKRAINVVHLSRGSQPGMPRLASCPECDAVRFQGKSCVVCGWRPQPRGEDVEVEEGDLSLVQRGSRVRRSSAPDKQTFFAMLVGYAQERGYQSGWASHKYKEKFGVWPAFTQNVLPIRPDDQCRAWIRSRQIAYAKAREKAGAA